VRFKAGLAETERSSKATDAAADDRDLDHSAKSATKTVFVATNTSGDHQYGMDQGGEGRCGSVRW